MVFERFLRGFWQVLTSPDEYEACVPGDSYHSRTASEGPWKGAPKKRLKKRPPIPDGTKSMKNHEKRCFFATFQNLEEARFRTNHFLDQFWTNFGTIFGALFGEVFERLLRGVDHSRQVRGLCPWGFASLQISSEKVRAENDQKRSKKGAKNKQKHGFSRSDSLMVTGKSTIFQGFWWFLMISRFRTIKSEVRSPDRSPDSKISRYPDRSPNPKIRPQKRDFLQKTDTQANRKTRKREKKTRKLQFG